MSDDNKTVTFKYHRRTTCRVCSCVLENLFDFGRICPSGFVDPGTEVQKLPLVLARCTGCGLVQLRHTVNADQLYRHYYYMSSLNSSMVSALDDVRAGIMKRLAGEWLDLAVVLDVGCNDGTLLNGFSEQFLRVGFDCALNVREAARNACDFFVNDYFGGPKADFLEGRVKVLTTIAMFYDLEDPHAFVREVKRVLRQDGIWVIQLADLMSMLVANAFDNTCFEHLEYYSLETLSNLLRTEGFDVFSVERNDVNGGSLRAYVCPAGSRPVDPSVEEAMVNESAYLSSKEGSFDAFTARISRIKHEVRRAAEHFRTLGTVAALGASTKGNTLLQWFGLYSDVISYAAEVNPDKFGKQTVGTRIPIIPEDEAFARKPAAFLVLPWHFRAGMIKRSMKYLDAGGRLIFPMPEPTLIEVRDGELVETAP